MIYSQLLEISVTFVTQQFQYIPEMEVLYIMSLYIIRLFRGCEFSLTLHIA